MNHAAVIFALTGLLACSKPPPQPPTCEQLFTHARSLAPPAMHDMMDQHRTDALERCAKLSDASKRCSLEATTFAEIQSCPRS